MTTHCVHPNTFLILMLFSYGKFPSNTVFFIATKHRSPPPCSTPLFLGQGPWDCSSWRRNTTGELPADQYYKISPTGLSIFGRKQINWFKYKCMSALINLVLKCERYKLSKQEDIILHCDFRNALRRFCYISPFSNSFLLHFLQNILPAAPVTRSPHLTLPSSSNFSK